jgi:hypothetical protein
LGGHHIPSNRKSHAVMNKPFSPVYLKLVRI